MAETETECRAERNLVILSAKTSPTAELPQPAYALPPEQVLEALAVNADTGLSQTQAAARLRAHGPNILKRRQPVFALTILIHQFASPVVLLLAVAAAVSLAYRDIVEALAIGAVLLINAAIGFVTEIRAVRSMEALRKLGTVTTRVRRDGRVVEIPAQKLVPGDIVVLEGGDIVTADLKLVAVSNLAIDESTLTGESLPEWKSLESDPPGTSAADVRSMVYKGTAVTRGGGEAVTVATGMNTELGRISALVAEAKPERSPLERQLDRLAGHLIWVTLAMCAVIGIAGAASGGDLLLMIEAVIALAVAAIPEGLPIVATMALARGMLRMSRQNALVERFAAVETLGSTTIIFTDKTGTLTENRLAVRNVTLESGSVAFSEIGPGETDAADPALARALSVAVLCNNAELAGPEHAASGDPIEVALLSAGQTMGLERGALQHETPRVGGVVFESETAMLGRTQALAEDGLRVLGVASKLESTSDAEAYESLVFLGLIGLSDPPRKDVPDAVAACHAAGIRVAMITGDHAVTARRIAAAIGLSDGEEQAIEGRDLKPVDELSEAEKARVLAANVFARVSSGEQARTGVAATVAGRGGGDDRRRGQRRPGAEAGGYRRRHGAARHTGGEGGGCDGADRRRLRHHRTCDPRGPGDLPQHPTLRGLSAVVQPERDHGRRAGGAGRAAAAAAAAADPVPELGNRRLPGLRAGGRKRGCAGPGAAAARPGEVDPHPLGLDADHRRRAGDHRGDADRIRTRPELARARRRCGADRLVPGSRLRAALERVQHARPEDAAEC